MSSSPARQQRRSLPDPRERIALSLLSDAGWSIGELTMTFQAGENTVRRCLEESETVLYSGGSVYHRIIVPNDSEDGIPLCQPLEADMARIPELLAKELLGAEECGNCWELRERP